MFFDSLGETFDAVKAHETSVCTKFVSASTSRNFGNTAMEEVLSKRRKVLWLDDLPYVVIGCKILHCHHGRDKHVKRDGSSLEPHDHNVYTVKKRKRLPSKKLDCPAVLSIREVLVYSKVRDPNARIVASKFIRADLAEGDRKFLVSFPGTDDHANHMVAEAEGIPELVDKRLIARIHQLVREGVVDIKSVVRSVQEYGRELCGDTMFGNVKRFNPPHSVVRGHMIAARRGLKENNQGDSHVQVLSFLPAHQLDAADEEVETAAADGCGDAVDAVIQAASASESADSQTAVRPPVNNKTPGIFNSPFGRKKKTNSADHSAALVEIERERLSIAKEKLAVKKELLGLKRQKLAFIQKQTLALNSINTTLTDMANKQQQIEIDPSLKPFFAQIANS